MPHHQAFARKLTEQGLEFSGAPLHGSDAATSVRRRGGDRLVTDGPFAETKEQLWGFCAAWPRCSAISYRRSIRAHRVSGNDRHMKPTTNINQPGGRVMPSCTIARGRTETLVRGRDSLTRIGPTPVSARPAASGARAR